MFCVGYGFQLCLGHCAFVLIRFPFRSVFESPMAMLGGLFIIQCGLLIVAIIRGGVMLLMHPGLGCC